MTKVQNFTFIMVWDQGTCSLTKHTWRQTYSACCLVCFAAFSLYDSVLPFQHTTPVLSFPSSSPSSFSHSWFFLSSSSSGKESRLWSEVFSILVQVHRDFSVQILVQPIFQVLFILEVILLFEVVLIFEFLVLGYKM